MLRNKFCFFNLIVFSLLVCCLKLAMADSLLAEIESLGFSKSAVVPEGVKKQAESLPFPVGECLEYSVRWGVLHVGKIKVWTEWVDGKDYPLIAIRAEAQTVSLMDAVYPINDLLESIVDPRTFLPLRFQRRLSEGRQRIHDYTFFNHSVLKAKWKHVLPEASEGAFAIEATTRDILSFAFFMRQFDWKTGTKTMQRIMSNDKLYDLPLETKDYTDVEFAKYGKQKSLLVEPDAGFQGAFIRVSRIKIWISHDKRRLCTMASAKIPVGSIRVQLVRVSGPGNDHWVGDEPVRVSARI